MFVSVYKTKKLRNMSDIFKNFPDKISADIPEQRTDEAYHINCRPDSTLDALPGIFRQTPACLPQKRPCEAFRLWTENGSTSGVDAQDGSKTAGFQRSYDDNRKAPPHEAAG